MRKLLYWCALLPLVSCMDEQRVDPATPSTFVRYINGGNPDVARDLRKTTDGGYIILANTTASILVSGTTVLVSKIKLIKTDAYGSVLWTKFYPEFDAQNPSTVNYRGNGILVTNDGYIIVGEVIQGSNSQLLLLRVDATGQGTATVLDPSNTGTSESVSGVSVAQKQNGNVLVLGSIAAAPVNNMILAEVDASNTLLWDKAYGSGASVLINRIFLDANDDIIWSGTVTQASNQNKTDLRLVRALSNSQTTKFDLNIGDQAYSEFGNDIVATTEDPSQPIGGFAIVGSSDSSGKADRDISFIRISESGFVLTNKTYPVMLGDQDVAQNEEGNSIAMTKDRGFIILGTIISTTIGEEAIGRGEKDYYLIKINTFGAVEWARAFGSKRDDFGVKVLQADDGGYVVLGTTMLANVETLALIKTNSLGEIE